MPVIGTTRHASEAELLAEAEALWQRDWVERLTRNGDVDIQQVKHVLAGYSNLQEIVSIVYDELSGGQLSKPGYNDTGQIVGVINAAMDESNNEMVIDALKLSLPETYDSPQTESALRDFIYNTCSALEIDPTRVIG